MADVAELTRHPDLAPMSRWRKLAVLAGLALALPAIAFLFWLTFQLRPREHNAAADVNWLSTGKDQVLHFEVKDRDEQPLAGIEVRVESKTHSARATTDAAGAAELPWPHGAIHEVRLNGVPIVERPYAEWLKNPSAERGLRFRVFVKDIERVKAGGG